MITFKLIFCAVTIFLCGFFARTCRSKRSKKTWRDDLTDHSRYKMVNVSANQVVAIWHGVEGWRIKVGEDSVTVPVFAPEHIAEIPETDDDYFLHFCVSMDGRALGFYAIYGE